MFQINVKICQISMRCWDSNSQPSEYESRHITTRPGLPPIWNDLVSLLCVDGTYAPVGNPAKAQT